LRRAAEALAVRFRPHLHPLGIMHAGKLPPRGARPAAGPSRPATGGPVALRWAQRHVDDTLAGAQPMVHSDRGGHYRRPGWLSRIVDAKRVRSMSRKAGSPDNAAREGFFGRLENELFYALDWLTTPIDEFVVALRTW